MTHCHNCGHSDSFVLLVELAFSVPSDSGDEMEVSSNLENEESASRDCSLAAQCPACDSTDVGVSGGELLARYASITSS